MRPQDMDETLSGVTYICQSCGTSLTQLADQNPQRAMSCYLNKCSGFMYPAQKSLNKYQSPKNREVKISCERKQYIVQVKESKVLVAYKSFRNHSSAEMWARLARNCTEIRSFNTRVLMVYK